MGRENIGLNIDVKSLAMQTFSDSLYVKPQENCHLP